VLLLKNKLTTTLMRKRKRVDGKEEKKLTGLQN